MSESHPYVKLSGTNYCANRECGQAEFAAVHQIKGDTMPLTPEGVGEMAMHYGEALAWIQVLEAFIVSNGLRVPTWADQQLDRNLRERPVGPMDERQWG